MGNTLDQHRATIGGFATRQVSSNWTPSSSSSSVFKSFESSGEDGGKTKSNVGQLAQERCILLKLQQQLWQMDTR